MDLLNNFNEGSGLLTQLNDHASRFGCAVASRSSDLHSKDFSSCDFVISSFNNQALLCDSFSFFFLFSFSFPFSSFSFSFVLKYQKMRVLREAPKATREFPLVRRRPPYSRELGDLRAFITYKWTWPPSDLLSKYLYEDISHAIININLSHIINLTS